MSVVSNFFENILFILSHLRWQDLVDIFLVWLVVYRILNLIRRTGTIQMLSGLGILAIAYVGSQWFELYTLNWLLEKFFSNLFVIVVVLFQGEIRRALAHIGSHPLFTDVSSAMETHIVEEIAKGVISAAQKGYGALIVIEKDILVDYHLEMGTVLESKISSEVIESIFHPQAPMHDGALLIRGGKIVSAGCFLPLSKNPALDKNLGTRHRAAIGLTEETDALVLVVSEETRSISLVSSGHMHPNVELSEVRQALYDVYGFKYKAYAAEAGGV
ncbi:MAG: TIGR00159 family protein [Bdellovibrionaceae bacterium]|nr:TIGR00159 family protein [Bdellovibrio sp.]